MSGTDRAVTLTVGLVMGMKVRGGEEFVFEAGEETPCDRVVLAIPATTHTLYDAMRAQDGPTVMTGELPAAVRVLNQPRRRLARRDLAVSGAWGSVGSQVRILLSLSICPRGDEKRVPQPGPRGALQSSAVQVRAGRRPASPSGRCWPSVGPPPPHSGSEESWFAPRRGNTIRHNDLRHPRGCRFSFHRRHCSLCWVHNGFRVPA